MIPDLQEPADWTCEEEGFSPERVVLNGNKFLLGNGALGYRGTLEEFGAGQLVGNMIAGLYDKVGDCWREPVNAPNALFAQVIYEGSRLSVLDSQIESHRQSLNIRRATHRRETVFLAGDGNRITITAERFVSLTNRHLMAMEFTVRSEQAAELEIETGIDADIWDINGPHLEPFQIQRANGILTVETRTRELGIPVSVAESVSCEGFEVIESEASRPTLRKFVVSAQAGRTYRLTKFAAIVTGNDEFGSVGEAARAACGEAKSRGHAALLEAHASAWDHYWEDSDVQIEGDPEAQFALRYSIYHLLAIAPEPARNFSIPARGLSGQVYKGAVFWDTEMFMLPFFLSARPDIARGLMLYRYRTLDGARRKAAEYGFEGAFYAWESQETGDDACTHFNVTDVFTGRPMRTYFRDKQIHISAAVACGFWRYAVQTGDMGILLEGGAEVILECARFYHSHAYYKATKGRLELLDVTGPDEYHERVNNNAYTNRMALETFRIALKVIEHLETHEPEFLSALLDRLDYTVVRSSLPQLISELHVPSPDSETGLIPQFDGYSALEDVSLKTLKSRVLNPSEYLGGGSGLATTTQILKQADVVLLLSLFPGEYSSEVKKRNWLYYEPRTEHGSSLSACAYALVAAEIGELDRAYKFFLQTATIDLTGKSKQYAGTIYIGGTHPAANGAAWIVAVNGFGGLRMDENGITLNPRLPDAWQSLRFRIRWHGLRFAVTTTNTATQIEADPNNKASAPWSVGGHKLNCEPGHVVTHPRGSKANRQRLVFV
jgi:nigerose phosphorylase